MILTRITGGDQPHEANTQNYSKEKSATYRKCKDSVWAVLAPTMLKKLQSCTLYVQNRALALLIIRRFGGSDAAPVSLLAVALSFASPGSTRAELLS